MGPCGRVPRAVGPYGYLVITAPATALTAEQRRIVEWGDGPVVVIAGAGTGKTRVIVERVRWLLETPRRACCPEQVLVLTYNVKAARELQERLDTTVGPATRARMTVTNFHSFCQRILTESAADAGLPPRPGRARRRRPGAAAAGHPRRSCRSSTTRDWALGDFVQFINRAKDELVDAGRLRRASSPRSGASSRTATGASRPPRPRLETQGNLEPLRDGPRRLRRPPRRTSGPRTRGETPDVRRPTPPTRPPTARPAARSPAPATRTVAASSMPTTTRASTPWPRPTIVDGAALEVLRLTELAAVYRAYEDELARRGALDFGEQIAAVDASCSRPAPTSCAAGSASSATSSSTSSRTPTSPRSSSSSCSAGRRTGPTTSWSSATTTSRSTASGAPASPPSPSSTRGSRARPRTTRAPRRPARRRASGSSRTSARCGNVLTAANRLIARNETRFEPDKRLTTDRDDGDPVELLVCAGAGGRGRRHRRRDQVAGRAGGDRPAAGPTSPSCTASTSTARRSWRGCATRTSRTPSSAA